MLVEELSELACRNNVAVHRVDAVGEIPHPIVGVAAGEELRLELVEVVVGDCGHVDSRCNEDLRGHVHAGVRLLIDEHGVVWSDEHRQHTQMAKRRRRWYGDRVSKDRLEAFP